MANNRLTEFGLTYDMSDITALKDSNPTTSFNKAFADISLLKDDKINSGQMTLEHNYSILDGEQEEFDDEPETIAFFTSEMSDENGEFETNPTIVVNFTEMHSSYALTLNFIDDYPLQIKCEWYQGSEIVLRNTYTVNAQEFIIRQSVKVLRLLNVLEILKEFVSFTKKEKRDSQKLLKKLLWELI